MMADKKDPQQWTPPEGATEQEPSSMAEFWKPQTVGDTLIGRVADIRTGTFGDYIAFQPVKLHPKGEAPQQYHSLKLALNSWLQKLIDIAHRSKILAVVYTGDRATPAGKMRTYRVFEVSPEKSGLLDLDAPPGEPGDDGDAPLPF